MKRLSIVSELNTQVLKFYKIRETIIFKVHYRSMITDDMEKHVLFLRSLSIKAQTRLRRLRTRLP